MFSKPGTIHLWKPDGNESSWTGLRTIALKTQKLSVGSTALAPVSGIVYLSRHDSVVVSLSDGSFHVIKNLSTAPTLASDNPEETMDSKTLSTLVRQHFVSIEGEGTRKLDVNSTHGMTDVDGESTFLWIHEWVLNAYEASMSPDGNVLGRSVRRTSHTSMMHNTPARWSWQSCSTATLVTAFWMT